MPLFLVEYLSLTCLFMSNYVENFVQLIYILVYGMIILQKVYWRAYGKQHKAY